MAGERESGGREGAGPWQLRWTDDGSPTLHHSGLDQSCHSSAGAWAEARERYAAATCLRERALAGARELRVADVGTGLGWNVAAALHALRGTSTRLAVWSFEVDPAVLDRAADLVGEPALRQGEWAEWFECVQAAIAGARRSPDGVASLQGSVSGELRLFLGDARETLSRLQPLPTFDAVFLDGFSPGADPPLWEASFLADIARCMAPGSWLSTYTASLTVRERLALAGLRVGSGARVGGKAEGTLASPDLVPPSLPERTGAKLARRLARRAAEDDGAAHSGGTARGGNGDGDGDGGEGDR